MTHWVGVTICMAPAAVSIRPHSRTTSPPNETTTNQNPKPFGEALALGPCIDSLQIDLLRPCDRDRLVEGLRVAPMIERCQSVHDALGRRDDLYGTRRGLDPAPFAHHVAAERNRARREFDDVHGVLMGEEAVLAAFESKLGENGLNAIERLARDEIQVQGHIRVLRIDGNRGAARQHRGDASFLESRRYDRRDLRNVALFSNFTHKGFPARRGRRRCL